MFKFFLNAIFLGFASFFLTNLVLKEVFVLLDINGQSQQCLDVLHDRKV
jgi:hypothetical protein